MEVQSADFWIARSKSAYSIAEDAEYKIWHTGIIFCLDGNDITPMSIGKAAFEGILDYNTVHGWFKLVVYAKELESWLFFGDNAGSQRLFIDRENGRFSDSLLALRALRGKDALPDMEAAAWLFNMGRMMGEKTIIKGVYKTDPDSYYRYVNGKIETFAKRLSNFSDLPSSTQLDDIVNPALKAIGNQKVCAVCTGGTDSRVVLANLIYRGLKPDLVITGHEDNPDISVAQEIAKTLGASLTIINPDIKEENWLEKAWIFLDGAYDVVLGYRHLQKAVWAKRHGYVFELDGVGGEFYKNAFCHPIRRGLFNKPDKKNLLNNLFQTRTSQAAWCGDTLRETATAYLNNMLETVKQGIHEKKLLQICNRIGYMLLQSGTSAITNGYAVTCCEIDPLMDRSLVASVSHCRPLTLSMHVWQRRQIATYCPALSEIVTDQGYSCSLKTNTLFKERCKRLIFYSGRVYARIRRKLGMKYKSAAGHYWDIDYQVARTAPIWEQALNCCKKLGVVRSEATDAMIPIAQTGNILLIGMTFGDDFNSMYYKYSQGGEE